jgi:multidrug resistance efflux pump
MKHWPAMRQCGVFLAILTFSFAIRAEDDLPKKSDDEVLEFEPEILLMDVKPDDSFKPPDVDKARTDMERSKNRAQRWQELQKRGVLSKVEAERAVIQANRAALRYQQTRVAAAKAQVASLRARFAKGEPVQEMIITAESSLKVTEQLAAEATALLQRTDAEFAKTNLDRQRQLSSMGLGSKAAVKKAEAKVKETQEGAAATSPP